MLKQYKGNTDRRQGEAEAKCGVEKHDHKKRQTKKS
jgi:hypothetical protein